MSRAYLPIVILLISIASVARASGPEFDHATILVRDLERSAEFYRNVLHLEELETPWGVNPSIRFFAIGNNQQLHLARGENDEVKLDKSIHIAFTVTDFDGYLRFLNDVGVAYSNFEGESNTFQTRPDGVKQVYLQDPDGYWIEINDAKH